MEDKELVTAALDARKRSYSPYSHFAVGAALLTSDGNVFTGCNIENSAYSPSICAERVAFSKAVSEGYREFTKIVIAGGPADAETLEYCPPCGVCRQVMSEFCDRDFEVILAKSADQYETHTLGGLLPLSFSL
ncbi:MAG: cytidine deaminase [Lachnospiraceae bacterium]|nr:cytidine deaminase [Lachnospiraceae bacterium]